MPSRWELVFPVSEMGTTTSLSPSLSFPPAHGSCCHPAPPAPPAACIIVPPHPALLFLRTLQVPAHFFVSVLFIPTCAEA